MSLTLTQATARVRSLTRDSAGTLISDTDITGWLNEAQEDLANRLMIVTTSATGTTSGNTISSDQTRLIKVRSLRLGDETDKDDVQFVDDDVFFSWMDSGDDPGFTIAIMSGGSVVLYPTPETDTAWTMYFYQRPADLSAGGDTSSLPSEFHQKMVYYAIARAKYKEADPNMGDRYMSMYEQGLPGMTLSDRHNPGPITLYPQQGPFDRSDYTS